ncbi:SMI1/KNR4 family protein [Dactylosporangium sp. NPDC005572]|uniref:SMI1/KNR4 family protein n=1 Tax=Dactylosporangium sp. NPDC005572 TaxID=3156889 RepID=UPI0033AB8743
MDELEAALRDLAAAFAAGLTVAGTERLEVTRRSMSGRSYDATGAGALLGRWGLDLGERRSRVQALAGDRTLAVELTGSPGGECVVRWTADLPSLPARIVFDEDYRFPGHPARGMPSPAAPKVTGRPTDPAVLAEVSDLVAAFVALGRRGADRLAPGVGEVELRAAEERIGLRLPEDLRALYGTAGADPAESGLLGEYSLAPLAKVVEWHTRGGYPGPLGGAFMTDPVVFETHPHGRVRRLSRNDWWVTIGPDLGMNHAAVDLDPAPLGTYGQVLRFGRDVHGPMEYVAPSVTHLLRAAVAAGRQRARRAAATPYRWDGGRVRDTAAIQRVTVDDAGLAGLARFRNLRSVTVRRAGEVDLALPPGLPVEEVAVRAERFEPGRLAGTPSLRYITLGENREAVRIAGLARLPELLRLDLSAAVVADTEALARFPALKVLVLSAVQWGELLATGWTPGRLAAAGCGAADVAGSVGWLNRMRGPGWPPAGWREPRV